jgi:hypothetical protein
MQNMDTSKTDRILISKKFKDFFLPYISKALNHFHSIKPEHFTFDVGDRILFRVVLDLGMELGAFRQTCKFHSACKNKLCVGKSSTKF